MHIYSGFLSVSPAYYSLILIYFGLSQAIITFCLLFSYVLLAPPQICREYAKQVHTPESSHKYFFPSPNGGQIPSINIYTNFRRFLWQAGIPHGGKGKGPRPYDFRHTFAVYCLKRMVLAGKDLGVYHQALKTYMGHSFFKYTAYYLRLTKDMFPDIRQKIETLYETILSGSGGEING